MKTITRNLADSISLWGARPPRALPIDALVDWLGRVEVFAAFGHSRAPRLFLARARETAVQRARALQRKLIPAFLCALLVVTVSAFAAEQTATYRLIGLSAPEREADLREVMKSVADVSLVSLDVAKSELTLRFDADKLGVPAKAKQPPAPDKITERLSSLLGNASKNTFLLAAPSTTPADKLTKLEIPIGVLDCKGCRYAAYQAVAKLDGVERATVSTTPSAIIAWIDATKTKRETLEEALKKARVELLKQP